MHELTPVVLFSLGALAVVGGIIYLAWVAAQKRRAALVEVALRMGFTFEAKVPKEQLGPFGPFHLFQRGYRRIARNLMTGKADDAPAMMLDYQYTIGGGKSSHTYHQTVALFPGAGTGLPEFTLAPERIWQKLGGLLGYQDIDFEASEEFSKHYLLRGPDETAIRAVFGAEALG
ncbi:MAG: hypothetical protein B7Z72_14810, partial [Gemmatimonadetes bacterium 21-71-4]